MVSLYSLGSFQEQRSRHAPHDQTTPAAEAAVRGDRRESRSERSPLTDDGAQGTSTTDAQACIFNTFTRSNRRVYTEQLPKSVFPLSCLIPLTFTHSNL